MNQKRGFYLILLMTALQADSADLRVIHEQPEFCLAIELDLMDGRLKESWSGRASFAVLAKWREAVGCRGSDWMREVNAGHELRAVLHAVNGLARALQDGGKALTFRKLSNTQRACFLDARKLAVVSWSAESWEKAVSVDFSGCGGTFPFIRATVPLVMSQEGVIVEPFVPPISATDLLPD